MDMDSLRAHPCDPAEPVDAAGTAAESADDAAFMARALQEARRGARGANPLVGAVLADAGGEVIAVGHHRGAGHLHAEREVLTRAAAERPDVDLTAATLYCTLEPCRHHGRQPPCVEAVLAAGVPRVVHGAWDPTATAGGGAAMLAARGVEVRSGVGEEQCRELNHRWTLAQRERRPFVTVHLAQSLDGRIAAADGTSQWITSAAARSHTHRIRARIDAILVGARTVAVDDPRLTARTDSGAELAHQPLRAVMGRRPVPEAARLRDGRAEGDGWLQLRTHDPLEALQRLAEVRHEGRAVRHVLVEGGSRVLSAFFAADLVDEIFAYHAPVLLGEGPSSVGAIGVETLEQAPRYRLDEAEGGPVQLMDDDVCVHLAPPPRPPRPDRPDAPDEPDESDRSCRPPHPPTPANRSS